MTTPIARQNRKRTYSLEDVTKIKSIAVRWGRAVDIIARNPDGPFLSEHKDLLEKMKDYREIFEPMLEETNLELNAMYPSKFPKPYNIRIPE